MRNITFYSAHFKICYRKYILRQEYGLVGKMIAILVWEPEFILGIQVKAGKGSFDIKAPEEWDSDRLILWTQWLFRLARLDCFKAVGFSSLTTSRLYFQEGETLAA